MTDYTIYNEDGRILRSVSSTTEDAAPEDVPEGCSIITGYYPADSYGVDTLTGEPFEIPPRPTEDHIFSFKSKTWVSNVSYDEMWGRTRARRDLLLSQSDWTQLPDVPIPTKGVWAEYRQALRDITNQPDPFSITWPTPPG